MKLIVFRVDASDQIGTGHLMRCLALANALKKSGLEVMFVCRHIQSYLQQIIINQGHELVLLDNAVNGETDDLVHSSWLGTSQTNDAGDTLSALGDREIDWLIVDHYGIDHRWESALRYKVKKIMVIDDIADRRHDCDALLDQNFYVGMDARYIGKVPVHCQLLLGPSYALLRDEFRQLREQVKPRSGLVRSMLVFFGGVDAENYTARAIDALVNIGDNKLDVDVVIGAQHPHREDILTTCADHGFICHVQTNRMAELMAAADLAVGAGGATTWERCCLGLPAIVVSLADNQIDIAKELDMYGACTYLGKAKDISVREIHNKIMEMLSFPDRLIALSEKAYSLVDGLGVDRVCRMMEY